MGRRVHTVRHGQGQTAWTERRETEVVGITDLTTDDHYGTPKYGRHHNRRDFEPNPIHAVVVRTWNGHEYGPGGKTVLLTHAPVDKPLQPFDDDDARSLIENGCIKEAEQPWDLGHPPQQTERAVLVHIVFTVLMFALATAYRLSCEPEATGGEPVGWRRWRRQLIEQTWDKVIVFAQEWYGIFPIAEFALLVGSSSTTCRQASEHSKKCWPNTGSHMAECVQLVQDIARVTSLTPREDVWSRVQEQAEILATRCQDDTSHNTSSP